MSAPLRFAGFENREPIVTLRIATAASFRYDRVAAHLRLLQSAEVDCVLLAYLDEESICELAIAREADTDAGYLPEITAAVRGLAPRLFLEPSLRLITDAGGLNPAACAASVAAMLADSGSPDLPLGTVRGDDLRESLEELYTRGCTFEHRETGAPFTELERPILAAQVQLGADGIRQALDQGARVVVAGVTAHSSLSVAAAVHTFGWPWDDWDRLAAAALAGTLVGQGQRVTCDPSEPPAAVDSPPPIVGIESDGQVTLSKVPAAEGRLTSTAVERALAAVVAGGPRVPTPDVELDLTAVQVSQRPERQDVLVCGAGGRPAAESYDVTLYHHDGYQCLATLWLGDKRRAWPADRVVELLAERVRRSGQSLESLQASGLESPDGSRLNEAPAGVVQLRATSRQRADVEQFADEAAALPRSIPCELILLDGPRPPIEPLVRRWPTTVPREHVHAIVEVRPARAWL